MPRKNYKEKLDADNKASMHTSRNARDIAGDYPPAGNLARRDSCRMHLRLYLETYHAAAFPLAWSPDHLKAIARIQQVILTCGCFALAMPRGGGKTTILIRAALWALLFTHRRYVVVVAAAEKRAAELLEDVKTELSQNELLAEDFRSVACPLRRIENNARRCVGQLFKGKQTRISWMRDKVVFPTMPESACDGINASGAIVTTAGVTSGILRGQKHTLPTGELVRPDLALLDDPQDRESASSASQNAMRLKVVRGDVLGMAGAKTRIAAFAALTVIAPRDLAWTLLDHKQSPQWAGERFRMLNTMPANMQLWEVYAQRRREDMARGLPPTRARELYIANREQMDMGARVAWPERYFDDEVSALQRAMNLRFDDEGSFMAEFQNEPLTMDSCGASVTIGADAIASKLNGIGRGIAPKNTAHTTAFVDVHDSLLYYAVCAWGNDFSGAIVDYGVWPAQDSQYFTLRRATRALASMYPGRGREGTIHAGLQALSGQLLGKVWPRENGGAVRIDRCLVDSGYVADTIYQFCGRSPYAHLLLPSKGVGFTAASKPISEYTRAGGDVVGFNWWCPKGPQRVLKFDSNFWKTFIHQRLAIAIGDVGCLSLCGSDPAAHRMIADHLTAEFAVETSGRGRTLHEWRVRPEHPDNHLFDCVIGCAVAASACGVKISSGIPAGRVMRPAGPPRKPVPQGVTYLHMY